MVYHLGRPFSCSISHGWLKQTKRSVYLAHSGRLPSICGAFIAQAIRASQVSEGKSKHRLAQTDAVPQHCANAVSPSLSLSPLYVQPSALVEHSQIYLSVAVAILETLHQKEHFLFPSLMNPANFFSQATFLFCASTCLTVSTRSAWHSSPPWRQTWRSTGGWGQFLNWK